MEGHLSSACAMKGSPPMCACCKKVGRNPNHAIVSSACVEYDRALAMSRSRTSYGGNSRRELEGDGSHILGFVARWL